MNRSSRFTATPPPARSSAESPPRRFLTPSSRSLSNLLPAFSPATQTRFFADANCGLAAEVLDRPFNFVATEVLQRAGHDDYLTG